MRVEMDGKGGVSDGRGGVMGCGAGAAGEKRPGGRRRGGAGAAGIPRGPRLMKKGPCTHKHTRARGCGGRSQQGRGGVRRPSLERAAAGELGGGRWEGVFGAGVAGAPFHEVKNQQSEGKKTAKNEGR